MSNIGVEFAGAILLGMAGGLLGVVVAGLMSVKKTPFDDIREQWKAQDEAQARIWGTALINQERERQQKIKAGYLEAELMGQRYVFEKDPFSND